MHISHDFFATKTCPSYEFFSSFRTGAGLRPKKCGAGAGWVGLRDGAGWKCAGAGRVRTKFLKLLRVRGGCGQKFQPAQDPNVHVFARG